MTSLSEPKNVIYGLFCACSGCRETRPGEIRYVGLTRVGLNQRFKNHIASAINPPDSRPELKRLAVYRWMRKHGYSNIRTTLLEICEVPGELGEAEVFWISHLDLFESERGLNMTPGGIGTLGFKHSEESKLLMKKRFSTLEGRIASSMPGSKHPRATMNESDVSEIKLKLWSGRGPKELALELGVPTYRIQQINNDLSWAHVPWPIGPRVRPPRRRLLTSEHITLMKQYRGEGVSYHEMARRFGVHVTVVHRHAKELGWVKPDKLE